MKIVDGSSKGAHTAEKTVLINGDCIRGERITTSTERFCLGKEHNLDFSHYTVPCLICSAAKSYIVE